MQTQTQSFLPQAAVSLRFDQRRSIEQSQKFLSTPGREFIFTVGKSGFRASSLIHHIAVGPYPQELMVIGASFKKYENLLWARFLKIAADAKGIPGVFRKQDLDGGLKLLDGLQNAWKVRDYLSEIKKNPKLWDGDLNSLSDQIFQNRQQTVSLYENLMVLFNKTGKLREVVG